MLKLNLIGEVLKDWTKNELPNGTCEYVVRLKVAETYFLYGKQEENRHLVVVKLWRKAENVPDFEKNLKKGTSVYVTCEMPDAYVGKNEATNAVYGYLASNRCTQFCFLGNTVGNFIHVQAIGGITADCNVNDLKNYGKRKVINFSVACSERAPGDKLDANGYPLQNTVYVSGGIFREDGKIGVAQYLTKGTRIYVEGKPVVRTGTDKAGNPRAYFNAEFYNVEFVGAAKKEASVGTSTPMAKVEAEFMNEGNQQNNNGLPF